MNYNHLYNFHVIAQEGSISRASRKLNLSQPTLSEQLKQFEGYMDTKLFDRRNGGLRLNEDGQRVLKFTEPMFENARRMLESFDHGPTPPKLRLEVGVVINASRAMVVHRLIDLFRQDETVVRVRQGDNQFLMHELINSGLDILISDQAPGKQQEQHVKSRVIASPKLAVIGPPDKQLQIGDDLPSTLHARPFVHYTTHSSYRWQVDDYFRSNQVEPQIMAEADDVHIILEAVRAGIGYGIVPRAMLSDDISEDSDGVELVGEVDRGFDLFAIYHNYSPSDETLRALEILTGGESGEGEPVVEQAKSAMSEAS